MNADGCLARLAAGGAPCDDPRAPQLEAWPLGGFGLGRRTTIPD